MNGIILTVSIFIIMLLLLSLTNNMTKSSKESFVINQGDVFKIRNTNARNCLELAQQIGVNTNMFNRDEQAILAEIENNKYRDASTDDSFDEYGTDECIIPGNIAKYKYNLANCQIGDIRLDTNNPSLKNVDWNTEEGCVISNYHLRNNLKTITEGLNTILTQGIENTVNSLQTSTSTNWSEVSRLDTWTSNNWKEAEDARYWERLSSAQAALNESQASEMQRQALANQSLSRMYDMFSEEGRQMESYIVDKIVGFRWFAFNGYFESRGVEQTDWTNRFLENIWTARIMPFDSGITNMIDMYTGISDSTANYKITNESTQITMLFEFIFRPDVDGDWRFELTSDDASYLWIYNYAEDAAYIDDNVSFFNGPNRLVLATANIANGGLHGMVTRTATFNLNKNMDYKVRIVQGNNWGPQGIRFRVARPNNSLFVLRSDASGVGAYDNRSLRSRYMVFDRYKRGMLCKVYQGYFWDSTNFFRNNKPMTAVKMRQAYNMNKNWFTASGHGITKTATFAENPEMIVTGNHNEWNPTNSKTHPLGVCCYPFNNTDTRSISFFGIFLPPETGRYTFYFAGDDAIYLWFGNQSKERVRTGMNTSFDSDSGYNSAWIKIPGIHGTMSAPFTIDLTQGIPTPVRMVQGDWGGGNTVVFGYKRPNGLIEHNLTKDFRF